MPGFDPICASPIASFVITDTDQKRRGEALLGCDTSTSPTTITGKTPEPVDSLTGYPGVLDA